MMHPTPRSDAGLCYCCGQSFAEPTRVYPTVGITWTGALARHTHRGVCPTCYNTYLLHHTQPWSDEQWCDHHRTTIAQHLDPRTLRLYADSIAERWPDLALLARRRAEGLDRRRATLDILDWAGRIKRETDAEELLWLAEALDSRSPELARLARRRATRIDPPTHRPHVPYHDPQERHTAEPTPTATAHTSGQRSIAWRSGGVWAIALTLALSALTFNLAGDVVQQACDTLTITPASISDIPSPPPSQVMVHSTVATAGHLPIAYPRALPEAKVGRLEEPGRLVQRAGGIRNLLHEGYEALQATEFDRAMGCFDRAAALNPLDPEAYLGQGHVHLAQGRTPWAIGAFETAHQLDPTHPISLLTLAQTYVRLGDRENALLYYERLLKRHPDHRLARIERNLLKASLRWEMPSLERVVVE
ncbi:MAG: tetratricopeptide repeat protein [Myxococcota bacterium]